MVQDKEVVLAILGASVGTASLLLVFQGFLVSAYRSLLLAGGRTEETREWYRRTIKGVLGILLVNLALTMSALSWLLGAESYTLVISLFVTVMAIIWVLAAYVALRLVR